MPGIQQTFGISGRDKGKETGYDGRGRDAGRLPEFRHGMPAEGEIQILRFSWRE